MGNEKPMVHVHLQQPCEIKLSEDGNNVVSQQIRHMVQWVHTRLDEDIIRSICKMARDEGVTDVTILDKEAVMSALRRAFWNNSWVRKPDGSCSCSACNRDANRDGDSWILTEFCPHCGAAMNGNVIE